MSGSTTGGRAPSAILPDTPEPVPALDELGQRDPANAESIKPTDQPAAEPSRPAAPNQPQPEAQPIPDPVPTVEFDQHPEPLSEQSWPNFRNGTDLRGIATSNLPDQPELMWELPTHDGITSTPAIANGKVYVAALSGHLFCLELKTGHELWRYRTIPNDDPEEFAPGFNAPVTLSDAAVYVGDEDGTLHALDRRSGGRLWTFPTNGEIKGGATVLPEDGSTPERVLFGSHDGRLYCLNSHTGEKIWEFDTLGPVNGSQAIDGQFTFVSGCDKPFLRVVDIVSGEQHAEVPLDGRLLIASPALVGEVLYFGTPEGEVVALDWRNQQTKWVYSDPARSQEIHSSPAATDELVLIGSRDKRLHAIERETGTERWNFETRGPIDCSPVVVGERVYFGSSDRNVYGVDMQGKEVFKYNAGQRISGSPAVGEGCLVIGCEGPDGKILCFGARE